MTTATVRRPAWAYVGKGVEGMSIDEALEFADLDFDVEAHPAFGAIPMANGRGYLIKAIEGMKHIYRPDKDQILSQVGSRYHVVQTREVVNLIEELVGGGWEPLFAGQIRKGRCVFMVGKLPFKTSDEVEPYLAFVNSFDGSTGVRIANTPIRPACTNAIRRTFRAARSSVSLRHTQRIGERVDLIRDALNFSRLYYERLDEEIATLLSTPADPAKMAYVAERLYPDVPNATDRQKLNTATKRGELMTHHATTPTISENARWTSWGMWNAVSEYEQWRTEPTTRNREKLLGAQLGTAPVSLKSDAAFRLVGV